MPKECRYMRTRLQIEYLRLHDWSQVAGLIELKDGEDLPESLRTDRLVLVAILTEIRALMEDFSEINGRYIQLKPEDDVASRQDAEELELLEEFQQISVTFERTAGDRRYPRGLNHIAKTASMAKEVVNHPKRLRWAAFDADVFLKLLGRLTELNDYLVELMRGSQARQLEQTTQKTYLEMVQVRSSIEELKHLVTATMLLDDRTLPSAARDLRRRNEVVLASLARFKSLNAATDAPADHRPSNYEQLLRSTYRDYSQVFYDEMNTSSHDLKTGRIRTEGKYYAGDGSQTDVWIEWKTYKEERVPNEDKWKPHDDNVNRVRELVALLQSPKPEEFCAPQCLGYFDDRDDDEHSDHDFRFGLIFKKPDGANAPISLNQMFEKPTPSLTARIALAHRISVSVLYLHAVNWLHKGLRSDSIVFFPTESSTNISHPCLSGFEYSRPDKEGETTTGGDVNNCWELYVHPDYQGSGTKGTYRKTFDIYSLGIVLLEIAVWTKVENIVGIRDPEAAETEELKGIRTKLLTPEYLDYVRSNLGDKYHEAVRSCIEGRSAFGIDEAANEASTETGAKLQQGFTNRVIDPLGGISL